MFNSITKLFKKKNEIVAETKAPDFLEQSKNLLSSGNKALQEGKLLDAEKFFIEAIAKSHSVDAHMNLGWVYKEQGKHRQAIDILSNLLKLSPNHLDALYVLGNTYSSLKEYNQAIVYYKKVVALNPKFQFVYEDLGQAHFELQHYEQAKNTLLQALEHFPNFSRFYYFLGIAYFQLRQYKNSIAAFQKTIDLNATTPEVYKHIANSFVRLGKVQENIDALTILLEHPEATLDLKLNALQSKMFNNYYLPGNTLQSSYALAQKLSKLLEVNTETYKTYTKRSSKYRVGFVSGDFIDHPVSFFLESVLKHINKEKFELIAYSTNKVQDTTTLKLKNLFDEWYDIDNNPDKIYQDNIDILIDLSGHSISNGLINFIKRPAPVQVTWLGYFGTIGLKAIDYLIADELCLYPNEEQFFFEKIKYLPQTRLCFTPPIAIDYQNITPSQKNGYTTFACYQNIAKINTESLSAWKTILDKTPNSIIKIHGSNSQDIKDELLAKIKTAGLLSSQYALFDSMFKQDYLKSYNDVDIILDTFPYNGGTTTCEALYMGVPTVTLKGNTMIARQGASMMTTVGLQNWVADNIEDYIGLAVKYAQETQYLNTVRAGLREQFNNSLLGNSKLFTENFENLLIEMYAEKTKI